MKFKFNVRREVKIVTILVVLFALIAFTERMKGEVSVGDIEINISNVHENHFVEETDIMNLMQVDLAQMKGMSIAKVNFKEIENRIKKDPFIEDAEVYSDLKGNIIVNADLRRPIARIVRNDGPDGYIAEDGTIMPVSDKFTPRVVLISGQYVRTLLSQRNILFLEQGKNIMEMLNMIQEDDFWKAQIAQLDIDGKGKVSIIPQVGDESIQFGYAEDLEVKFRKLNIYYKEILPRVGWNKYNKVNVEFEGQIVAE